MKKLLIAMMLLASFGVSAQIQENLVRMDTWTTPFIIKYYPKQLIRVATDSTLYALTHATQVGQTMKMVQDSGWYKIVGRKDADLSIYKLKSDSTASSGYATQYDISGLEPAIGIGTTGQYWRGDKTWQTLPITETLWERIPGSTNNIHNTNSKYIGIGTSNPQYLLDVYEEEDYSARAYTVNVTSPDSRTAIYGLGGTGISGAGSWVGTAGLNYGTTEGYGVYGYSTSGIGGYFGAYDKSKFALKSTGKTWLDSLVYVKYLPMGTGSMKMIVWDTTTKQFMKYPIPTPVNYWSRTGGTVSLATSGDTLALPALSIYPSQIASHKATRTGRSNTYANLTMSGFTGGVNIETSVADNTNVVTRTTALGLNGLTGAGIQCNVGTTNIGYNFNTTSFAPSSSSGATMPTLGTAVNPWSEIYGGTGNSTQWNSVINKQDSTLNPFKYSSGNTIQRSTGNVGIGTSSPSNKLTIQSDATQPVNITSYSPTAQSVPVITNISRGTESSPAAVETGDALIGMNGKGYNGSAFSTTGKIQFTGKAAETWTPTANGTYFTVSTTPIGSTTTSERLRITDAGNVGIKTTSPATELDVNGVVTATGGNSTNWNTAYSWGNHASAGYVSGTGISGYIPHFSGTGSIDSSAVYYDALNKRVGIGTTAPAQAMDITGSIVASGFGQFNGISINGSAGMALSSGTRGNYSFGTLTAGGAYPLTLKSGDGGTRTGGIITHSIDGGEKLRINSTGVGIGTTAPATLLHVNGTSTLPTILGGSAVDSYITYKSTSGSGTSSAIGHKFVGGADGNTTIMTMLNDGKVGIGTTGPTDALSVTGAISASTYIYSGSYIMHSTIGFYSGTSQACKINATSSSGGAKAWEYRSGSSGKTGGMHKFYITDVEAVRIDSSRRVGIGTTAPPAKLSVLGGNLQVSQSGGDSVSISSGNAVRLHGNATVWNDLMFPFQTGVSAGTGYPTFVADSLYYTFVVDTTGASKCIMYMTIQMPHWWKEGSTIYPHIHYKHETGVGTPNFILKYRWSNIGAGAVDNWSWYRMGNTTGTTNKTHQMSYGTGGISGSGKGISSILFVQIYLRTTPANVNAYQFDLHVEQDALGSNLETSKN